MDYTIAVFKIVTLFSFFYTFWQTLKFRVKKIDICWHRRFHRVAFPVLFGKNTSKIVQKTVFYHHRKGVFVARVATLDSLTFVPPRWRNAKVLWFVLHALTFPVNNDRATLRRWRNIFILCFSVMKKIWIWMVVRFREKLFSTSFNFFKRR